MGDDTVLLTPRLRLRRWRESDREPMAAINREPEVTEFLNRPVDEAAAGGFGVRGRGGPSLNFFVGRMRLYALIG